MGQHGGVGGGTFGEQRIAHHLLFALAGEIEFDPRDGRVGRFSAMSSRRAAS